MTPRRTGAALAALLPDLPRWVEIRSMLRSHDSTVLGVEPGDGPSFVVADSTGTSGVVGRPGADIIRLAGGRSREVLVAPEDAEWVGAALAGWTAEPATLHVLPGRAPHGDDDRHARIITAAELASAPGLPADLRGDLLREVDDGTPLAAAFTDGRPVAFCYPSSMTERWWDVSIDTLEPFRRQGHAARAFHRCAGYMARAGRDPVWGSLVSNRASAGLAAKLGFAPTDTLIVFTRRAG